MRMSRFLLAAILLCSLTACGGGGGGESSPRRSNTISLSIPALTLSHTQGDTPPTATVTVTFSGAGVAVGSLPNQTPAPWLQASAQSAQSSPATVQIAASAAGLGFGTYSTTLRFATADADQSNIAFVDLPITFSVKEGFGMSNAPLLFSEFVGNAADASPGSVALQIRGDDIIWDFGPSPAWLKVTPSSGTGAATVQVSIARPWSQPAGTYQHSLQVRERSRDISIFLPVTYTVRTAQLQVDTTPLSFNVGPATTVPELSRQLVLSDDALSAPSTDLAWQAASSQDWLQLSRASGRTSVTTPLVANLSMTHLESLSPDFRSAEITITATDRSGTTSVRKIPVTFNLALPFLRAANPYLIAPSTAATVNLRGEGLIDSDFERLRVGSQAAHNVRQQLVLDTGLLFDVPASGAGSLAAGRHLITVDNALGLVRSTAELLVQTAIVAGPGTIVSTGRRNRLIYDPQRGRLYASYVISNSQIQRFQWSSSTSSWSVLPPLVMPNGVTDMDIDRGGRRLIVAHQATLQAVPLDANPPTSPMLIQFPADDCDLQPFHVRVLADDEAIVSRLALGTQDGCNDQPLLRFDLVRNQLIESSERTYYRGLLAPTLDRQLSFVGPGIQPVPTRIQQFDSRTHYESTPNFGGLQPLLPESLEAGNDRGHLLINHTEVWDIYGPRRGVIPLNRRARFSPDARRLYAYVHSNSESRRIKVYDVDWNALVGGVFPLLTEIPITTDLGDVAVDAPLADDASTWMELSEDGKLIFLSGLSAIEVVATPP